MGKLNKTNKRLLNESIKELGTFTYKEVLDDVQRRPTKGKSKPPSENQVISFLSMNKDCSPIEKPPKDTPTKYKYVSEEDE